MPISQENLGYFFDLQVLNLTSIRIASPNRMLLLMIVLNCSFIATVFVEDNSKEENCKSSTKNYFFTATVFC